MKWLLQEICASFLISSTALIWQTIQNIGRPQVTYCLFFVVPCFYCLYFTNTETF